MRKDVKLGMAIGGGLIAVLVGYLLFAPPSNNKKGTQLAGGAGSIIDPGSPGDLTQGSDEKQPVGKTGGNESTAPQTPAPTAGRTPDASSAPQGRDAAKPVDPPAPKPDDKDNKSKADWNAMLDKGKAGAPTVKEPAAKPNKPAETVVAFDGRGTPAASHQEPKLYFNPNEAWGGGISTDAVPGPSRSGGAKTAVVASILEAKPAAAGGGATHVVQSGETLSSIAQVAYGSASYYPHILRANPAVNPNNLKLGTVLNLPKVEDVKAAVATEQAGRVANSVLQDAKIDPTTHYRVQSGDSLYKISLKVYGKSGYVERIYDRNKVAIGSDPKRLKLGMVLELPEKAPAATATPSDTTASTLNDGTGQTTEDNQVK